MSDPVERLRFVRTAQSAYRPQIPHWCYLVRGRPPAVRLFGIRWSKPSVKTAAAVRRWSRPSRWGVAVVMTATLALTLAGITSPRAARPVVPRPAGLAKLQTLSSQIWLVENSGGSEVYSNGLRIETAYQTATARREWRAYGRRTLTPSAWRSDPAGIVYHTTESQIAPLEAALNASLRRNAAGVLDWVKQTQCYHFVIDRFGRVFRVVAETDYANHAGHSVWADSLWVYTGLNQCFLGVAFEAAQGAGIPPAPEGDAGRHAKSYLASPAQIHAAHILTDMLRSRYRIDAANCVTHAQVSINSQKMAIGYHTDWASDFPFEQLGLGDGYGRPLASIAVFGFEYDASFLHAIGRQVWPGMLSADEQILRDAAGCGMTPADFRARLQRDYRTLSGAIKAGQGQEPSRLARAGAEH